MGVRKVNLLMAACLAYSLTMRTEAIRSSETSVLFYWTARHTPEQGAS
jgi:hypothetical protein